MDMLNQKGAAEAFYSFAAPDAVIKRGDDELIAGPDAIKTYYAAPIYQNATAEWRPDFIDVANDGSMAYTSRKIPLDDYRPERKNDRIYRRVSYRLETNGRR